MGSSVVSRSSSAFISPRPLKRVIVQALFAGGADGGGQAAQVFEAGFVFAAAERVARALLRRCALAGSGPRCRSRALRGRSSSVLIVRTSCSSTMWSLAAPVAVGGRGRRRWRSAVGDGGVAGGAAAVPRSTLSSPPAPSSCCGDERVERFAGGEPVLLAAEEDVVHRQLAGRRVLPHGVDAEADAAALQRDDARLPARPACGRAWPSARLRSMRPSPGSNTRVGQAELEQLGPHLLFGLHVVGVLLVAHAEQRRLGDVDVARRRPARTSGGRRR